MKRFFVWVKIFLSVSVADNRTSTKALLDQFLRPSLELKPSFDFFLSCSLLRITIFSCFIRGFFRPPSQIFALAIIQSMLRQTVSEKGGIMNGIVHL